MKILIGELLKYKLSKKSNRLFGILINYTINEKSLLIMKVFLLCFG